MNIGFAHGDLTISGSRRSSAGKDSENSFYVRERFYGEFRRTIRLPDGTQPSQIAAVFDNGLVEITVHGGASHTVTSRIELRERSGQATTRSLG